jgi:hypothetical protein
VVLPGAAELTDEELQDAAGALSRRSDPIVRRRRQRRHAGNLTRPATDQTASGGHGRRARRSSGLSKSKDAVLRAPPHHPNRLLWVTTRSTVPRSLPRGDRSFSPALRQARPQRQSRDRIGIRPLPAVHAQLDCAPDERGNLLVGVRRVAPHALGDDTNGALDDPTLVRHVGKFNRGFIDALEATGRQLVCPIEDPVELVLGSGYVRTWSARHRPLSRSAQSTRGSFTFVGAIGPMLGGSGEPHPRSRTVARPALAK